MSDLGILLASIAAERMRDRTHGALTPPFEPADATRKRRTPLRFRFLRPGKRSVRTATARTA